MTPLSKQPLLRVARKIEPDLEGRRNGVQATAANGVLCELGIIIEPPLRRRRPPTCLRVC
jgi:hypothetical protein